MSDLNVAAIIVTYNPEMNRFNKVIDSITNQINRIIIVDNNSKNRDTIKENLKGYTNIEIIENNENYGIGKGLNIGVERLKDSMDWILTLDQDTIVLVKIKELLKDLSESHESEKNVGILALNVKEEKNNYENKKFINGFYPIISGTIVNSVVYKNGLRYREEFFLDHVDTDFDFSVRYKGFKILITTKKCIDHEWGKIINSKKKRCQSNFRIYLTIRNGTRLFLERKIPLMLYALDNALYLKNLCRSLKNFILLPAIIMLAITDGFTDKFLFFEKFKVLS
jgi:rhamnosyltransferase